MHALTDIEGQAEVLLPVGRAAAARRLHHALLVSGPAGVGQFEAALALARTSYCAGPEPGAAACRCAACRKFETGHPDVHVLETSEKMLKVDDVRRETAMLHLRPLEAPFKWLIVRDAEKLNPQAQNALLKTIEEPPGGTHVALATARPDLLLVTVRSRCQRISLRPLSVPALAARLAAKKGLAPEAARLVAALAEGSPSRAEAWDAERLFEERDLAAGFDLDLGAATSPGAATLAAAGLADPSEAVKGRLDLLRVWTRDQLLAALGEPSEALANADRAAELDGLAESRGRIEILRRAHAIEQARRRLDAPYNFNALLVLEELALTLIGGCPVRPYERRR